MPHDHSHDHADGHDHAHGHDFAHEHSHDHWSDETARWYAQNYGDWPTQALAAAMADPKPGQTIVDIGCGTGATLRLMAAQEPGAKYIGVDPTPAMVGIAQDQCAASPHGRDIRIQEWAVEALPMRNATVDMVMTVNTVFHWKKLDRAAKELRRVLAADGRLLLVEEDTMGEGKAPDLGPVVAALEAAGFSGVVVAEASVAGPDGEIAVGVVRWG